MKLRLGILIVSDRAASGERPDLTGPAIQQVVAEQGWQIMRQEVLPDELPLLRQVLLAWADSKEIDIILTAGGTGFSPRDVTPEATLAVIQRQAFGLAEAMRAASLALTPHAMLSRAVAGIRNQAIIINLPGSPTAAVENLRVVIPVLAHAVQLVHADPAAEAGHQAD